MNLRKRLERYNEHSCPDYLYSAWRILFRGNDPPDKKEILQRAGFDLREEELARSQKVFNRDRYGIEGRELRKYNW